jgi:hypothetical protein
MRVASGATPVTRAAVGPSSRGLTITLAVPSPWSPWWFSTRRSKAKKLFSAAVSMRGFGLSAVQS